jgi:hypothetical protein
MIAAGMLYRNYGAMLQLRGGLSLTYWSRVPPLLAFAAAASLGLGGMV